MCIYELNSLLKCSFKSILEKKHQNISPWSPSFVCRTWNVYLTVYSEKPPLPQNVPGCTSVGHTLFEDLYKHQDVLVSETAWKYPLNLDVLMNYIITKKRVRWINNYALPQKCYLLLLTFFIIYALHFVQLSEDDEWLKAVWHFFHIFRLEGFELYVSGNSNLS